MDMEYRIPKQRKEKDEVRRKGRVRAKGRAVRMEYKAEERREGPGTHAK
jgi:hypothetical protein